MPVSTTCRICESACGLLATVDKGRVVRLEPDPDDPVSNGYACRKGTQFHRTLERGDRVLHPRVDGERATWDEALATVGAVARSLLDAHGPEALGVYSGNALGHSFGGVLGVAALQRALGTSKHYSCLTLDNSEMFAVADWVFGHPLTTFLADYQGADALVLIGTDPLSSQPGQAQSRPGAVPQIRDQRARLTVLDPRRSATASVAAHHLQPRVGTDVFVLAWLVSRFVEELPLLAAAVAPYTLERTVRVSGLPETELTALEQRIRRAERPLIWSGLGVLLGPHGTLGWWLTLVLQSLTGGIGAGRPWYPSPAGRFRRLLRAVPLKGSDPNRRSRIGNWPSMLDTLPAATLSSDILTPGEGQLRALFVVGGEPLRALPDTRAAERAFAELDLLVAVSLFETSTTRRAHVVLPAASWLEREESALHNLALRDSSVARRVPAVVSPAGEALPDWVIFGRLCDAIGRPRFGSRLLDAAARRLSPDRLADWIGSEAASADPEPRLEVPHLCEALAALEDPEVCLRLVTTVRPPGAMNHWIRPRREPAAVAHPEDLAALGLVAGPVAIHGPAGSIVVELDVDATVRRGTVVVPFGATSINRVIGTERLEGFSGQPISNGTAVTLSEAEQEVS